VPDGQHQPDLFAADNHRRQKLSPLIDRINDRDGRCAIGFGLFPPDVRAFKGCGLSPGARELGILVGLAGLIFQAPPYRKAVDHDPGNAGYRRRDSAGSAQ
jgi:hypothetical protein